MLPIWSRQGKGSAESSLARTADSAHLLKGRIGELEDIDDANEPAIALDDGEIEVVAV
jgi:hypothetical protein